jgi:hypothetical protein
MQLSVCNQAKILIPINIVSIASRKRKQRKPYNQIETHKRRMLLQLVEHQGLIIKEAAERLNINYSTAKTIL